MTTQVKKDPRSATDDLKQKLKTRTDELAALYDVSRSITSSTDLQEMLSLIAQKVARILRAKVCGIHLLDGNRLVMKAHHGFTRDLSKMMGGVPLHGNFLGLAFRKKRSYIVRDLCRYPKHKFYPILKKCRIHSFIVVPLVEKGKAIGTICVVGAKPGAYSRDDEKELTLFAGQAAVAIENARLFQETKHNYLNTMRLLASVIDAKDSYTEDHSEKVMRYALGIAKKLRLAEGKKQIIKFAAILHDIGKINIDVSILRKAGPLTRQEWQKIIDHPRVGAEIISKAGFLKDLVPAILYHHVKYSGGGYPPCDKKGTRIPIEARILAVADAYEAMTSTRPYRSHLSKQQAVEELRRCAGTQFDPLVVKAFLLYLGKRR